MLIIVAYKILLLQVLLPEGSKICSKTSSGGPYLLTNLVPGVVQICQGREGGKFCSEISSRCLYLSANWFLVWVHFCHDTLLTVHVVLFITSLSKKAISTPISHLFLSLLLLLNNDEVVEGIVSPAFLHGINSDCSHTHRSTGHYIRIYSGYPKQLLRGQQRPSVVVWDVPRIACPRLDAPQIFALGHRRSSIDILP